MLHILIEEQIIHFFHHNAKTITMGNDTKNFLA